GPPDRRPHDRARPPRGGIPRAVRGRGRGCCGREPHRPDDRAGQGRLVSVVLLGQVWRSQRTKLLIVCLAIAGWSVVLPVIYQSFGHQMEALINSGVIPKQLTSFGGGDVFSLGGAIALGYVHPISIILLSVFAIGFATSSIAGERQRGTPEVS